MGRVKSTYLYYCKVNNLRLIGFMSKIIIQLVIRWLSTVDSWQEVPGSVPGRSGQSVHVLTVSV